MTVDLPPLVCYNTIAFFVRRGRSSIGRALPSQGRGRGFESHRLHHDAEMAEPADAPVSKTGEVDPS